MTAPADIYQVASGQPIYGGRASPSAGAFANGMFPDTFDGINSTTDGGSNPVTWNIYQGKPLVLSLAGSGGENYTTGLQIRAAVSGRMAYSTYNEFAFSLVAAGSDAAGRYAAVRPNDDYGLYPGNGSKREGFYSGFRHLGTNDFVLISARRIDAMMKWVFATYSANFDMTRLCVTGGSMGADGCFTYAIRRPQWFAAIYSDRGRCRYAGTQQKVFCPTFDTVIETPDATTAPNIAPEDGGGKFMDYQNAILYVSNPANKLPWLGWGMGLADTNYSMADHADLVDAMRARKAGFCFVWSTAGHETTTDGRITASYPFGTFQIGKSYPYFSEHSLDKNPRVDTYGGINEGLKFDPASVVDTAGQWSCNVTSIVGPCTVKVEPCNPVNFPAGATAKLVTIPAANIWVTVSFTA